MYMSGFFLLKIEYRKSYKVKRQPKRMIVVKYEIKMKYWTSTYFAPN